MKISQSIKTGAWLLITLNLLMAFGSIWIFTRMAPAIEIIIDRNERSQQACEEMLAYLALVDETKSENDLLKKSFETSLQTAQNNITEKDEPAALKIITDNYHEAFNRDLGSRKNTIYGLVHLGRINRLAMIKADKEARDLGNAGAWGIVFMAITTFLSGIIFIRKLLISTVKPIEEINRTIESYRSGDIMRRCTGYNLSKDMRNLFSNLNDILDRKHIQTTDK